MRAREILTLTALAWTLAASGCSAYSGVGVKPLSRSTYAPSAVAIVAVRFPDRSYVRLAELTVERGPKALDLLREQGRKLGADAVVLVDVEDKDQLRGLSNALNPSRAGRSAVLVKAVAIRY